VTFKAVNEVYVGSAPIETRYGYMKNHNNSAIKKRKKYLN
jgi:hypothetical protein